MDTQHTLAFIETKDQNALLEAVIAVNRSRKNIIPYTYVILTAPRRGWCGMLFDRHHSDHYLIRNLSGHMNTRALELALDRLSLRYRVHYSGRTLARYESHVWLYITAELELALKHQSTDFFDLAEPAERFALERYQHMQHRRSIFLQRQDIPDALLQQYEGDVKDLHPFFRPGTDRTYIRRLLEPGHSAERAFLQLVSVLDVPYIPPDHVYKPTPDNPAGEELISGLLITDPYTWRHTIPDGWLRLLAEEWA